MILSYPRLQAHNPFRPTDWRWRRARRLVERGRYYCRGRDDEPTGQAVYYLRTLARRPGIREVTLLKRFPAIHAARQLHEDGRTRLLVEAHLLARQTSSEIARLTGIAVEVIDAFEAVFFNVRPSLDARDWILTRAIGISAGTGAVNSHRRVILKCFAYYGGPLVLDAVRPYLLDDKDLFDPPLDLSTLQGRREQTIRLAVAAQMLLRDTATDKKLHRIMLLLQERDRKRPSRIASAALGTEKLSSNLANVRFGASARQKTPQKCTPSEVVPAPAAQVA